MATSPISCELIGDAPAARAALQRPLQRLLERDVSVLGAVEREIVAEEKEALLARRDQIDDVRQVDEVVLLHLDQPQALPGILVEQALHDRGFTGAARAREEHVVRGLAVDELARVLLHALDL